MHDEHQSTDKSILAHRPAGRWSHAAGSLRGQNGSALVEFALVLPLLLVVVIGIVSFGRVMNYNEQATHLVAEAARYAAVNQVPAGAGGTLGQWVRSQAQGELGSGGGSVSSSPTVCVSYPSGAAVGNPVQIQLTFGWNWLPFAPFGHKLTSSTITQSADMRIEVAPTGSFYAAGCS